MRNGVGRNVRRTVAGDDIVITLQGGLGNQLFQWAFGRALRSAGRTVVFDRVRCGGSRPYALGDLIPARSRLSRFTGWRLLAWERLGRLDDSSRIRYVRQQRSGYDATVLDRLSRAAYVRGSFQSPKYFESVEDVVRGEVMAHLFGMLTPEGGRLAGDLQRDPQTVAIHVRRGDYVTNPGASAMHGVLGAVYYDRALEMMSDRGFTRRVWFSDDLDWVRQNFARPGDVICPSGATLADGGEIALMASCHAQIIANSSFSWWGGWLAGDPESSSVIAPKSWFADGHSDVVDLIPSGWTQL